MFEHYLSDTYTAINNATCKKVLLVIVNIYDTDAVEHLHFDETLKEFLKQSTVLLY